MGSLAVLHVPCRCAELRVRRPARPRKRGFPCLAACGALDCAGSPEVLPISQLKRLLPYLRPYRWQLLLGALSLLLANGAALLIPRLVGRIIDSLNGATPETLGRDWLLREALLLVGLTLLAGIGRFFMRWLMIGASRRIEYDIRNDFFAHLLRMDAPWFGKMPLGDLMARATNDLNAVRMLLGPGIMNSVSISITLVFALSLMATLDLRLTLISLAPLPFLSLVVYNISRILHRGFEQLQARFSSLTSRVQENFSGIRVVKAFVLEEHEIERFQEENRAYYRRSLTLARHMGLFHPSMRLFSGLSVILVLWTGGRSVMAGEQSLGVLVAFMQYLIMLGWPIAALGWITSILQRGSASWKRLLAILDEEPAIRDGSLPARQPRRGRLEIRDLSFSYGEEKVLDRVSLEIPAGGSLGVTGRTGSGKSTLLSLIPRIQDPPPGTVFLDGVDLRELSLEDLRASVSWVGQEPLLFSESLADNLAWGDPGAPRERLEEAARDSGFLDEIREFPQGWNTVVGERGTRLSGGQKQRACLARALLRGAPLLVLDAPFSSVDTQTEEIVLGRLRRRFEGRTVILVSHRASTLRLADRICVLERGRVAELGSHEELLALGGLYAEIHERQLLRDSLEQRRSES